MASFVCAGVFVVDVRLLKIIICILSSRMLPCLTNDCERHHVHDGQPEERQVVQRNTGTSGSTRTEVSPRSRSIVLR